MKLEEAALLANEAVELLRPFCERIEIAGGIRRGKPEPHDIEIVVKPKFEDATLGFFQPVIVNKLDSRMEGFLHDGDFERGELDKAGKRAPCGPKYYRLKFKGAKLDLFSVIPPAQWGVVFAIRTGDADYSHWLVQQGWGKAIKVVDGHLVRDFVGRSETISTPEEGDVFKWLGVKMPPPKFRDYRATRTEPIPTDPLFAASNPSEAGEREKKKIA